MRCSDLVPLEQLLADDHALDLARALADQQQRRVAVDALDLVLLGVAVAAVDAQGLLGAEAAGLRGEELGHARLEVRALAGVLHARGADGEHPRGLELGGHVGELELDHLVLGDRLAERLALLGVLDRQLEGALGQADAAGGDVDAADLERVHHLREALVEAAVLAAEDRVRRRLVAVEDQLGRLDALVAHLLDLGRDVEAGERAGVLLDARLLLADEARHALVALLGVGVGLDEREDQRAAQPVGDPHLRAVDLVRVVVDLLGGRLDRLDVGAELGLGQRERGAHLAGGHARQPLLLLLVGAELQQQVGPDEVRVDHARDRDPAARELLDDHGVGREVQAEPLHLLDDGLRELVGAVVVLGIRDDLLVRELADHLGDRLLLVGLLLEGDGYGHGFSYLCGLVRKVREDTTMTFERRLQRYLRGTAARGREVVRAGPFTAYLDRSDALRFLNYAIPDEGAAPTAKDAAELARAFAARDRLPRLEYVEDEAPGLAAALEAAGYAREATLDLMTCTPATLREPPPPDG